MTVPWSVEVQRPFPNEGPGTDEETARCQPPEALDQGGPSSQEYWRDASFDLWGVGVMWLELLLGTTDVWNRIKATAQKVTLTLALALALTPTPTPTSTLTLTRKVQGNPKPTFHPNRHSDPKRPVPWRVSQRVSRTLTHRIRNPNPDPSSHSSTALRGRTHTHIAPRRHTPTVPHTPGTDSLTCRQCVAYARVRTCL